MVNGMIHKTADVCSDSKIGENTKIWHYAQVREKVNIGDNCIIGKNVYIDFGVKIGDNVKIQNNANVYHGVTIENGVFIGPNVCLTNDKMPRAVNPDGTLKTEDDWEVGNILIKKGASIGAGSVVLPNVTVGKYSIIGAGSVITKDVPNYCLAYGNPASVKGYVCKCGEKIKNKCLKCGVEV